MHLRGPWRHALSKLWDRPGEIVVQERLVQGWLYESRNRLSEDLLKYNLANEPQARC
mgnify:CR=1 FL=1